MWISAYVTLVGAILQASSQNIAMFTVARFIIGLGNGGTFVCGPVYLAETLPMKWRGIGLGLFMSNFYTGMRIMPTPPPVTLTLDDRSGFLTTV